MPRRQKKKTWGGENKKVCVRKGLCGGTKNTPIPDKKALDAGRPGPTGNKRCRQNPKKGASIAPALEALPLALTRARGWGDPLYPLRCDHLLGFSRQSVAAERKGEKKNKAEEAQNTLAASRPKKRASEGAGEQAQAPLVQGESHNRAGPRMAPREKRREAGPHGQNGRNRQKRRETKRKRNRQKQVRVKGCPVTT